ncbi:hypothetical protein KUTeg_011858 [Tegillarca granosa]|uniref:Uncharacterized protein n=1 Tax=Tegillarca granosa TaxID=220873 RepID=A0ABQ9EXW6_TEGGR|nr:hypothetical protein KUTeg_011858 [Tegillarca granosa]
MIQRGTLLKFKAAILLLVLLTNVSKGDLTMDEFITAFGRYKRVMCLKFPDRREELDIYEAHMNAIYRHFGPAKCFSDQHSARNCQKSVQGNNRQTQPNRASSQYKPAVPENANRSNNNKS